MKLSEILDAICNDDIFFLEKNVVSFGINSSVEEDDGDTLLQYAISDKGSNVYKQLIELGANLQGTNSIGENILHSAIYSGLEDRVKFVIYDLNTKIDIDKANASGTTPLLLSLFLEHEDIALLLIEAGANVHIRDNDGNSPLHVACFYGYLDVIKKIVEKGVDFFQKDIQGNYPLSIAINRDHVPVVNYLYKIIYEDGDL